MSSRVKSAIATAAIQGLIFYALMVGLTTIIPDREIEKVVAVDLRSETEVPPPPPEDLPPPVMKSAPTVRLPVAGKPDAGWEGASALQREVAFVEIHKWREANLSEDEKRAGQWREELPQGSGPGRVVRLQPSNLGTHTLYWPAKWSRGKLPIIVWGNGQDGRCSNSSLFYAAFLAEIASYGYFVVAVGNDDIDYPQPEGLQVLADGRPLRTQASALRKAVDWAVAENSRPGSPYAGRLDASKIAYMGHGCGGLQAMQGSSDPRATTTVVLNAPARFAPDPSAPRKATIAHFAGSFDDDRVHDAGDISFARAQTADWPMFKASLGGIGYDAAYPGPDRRWSGAVLAWLDWQLKGDASAAKRLDGLARNGWSRIDATGIALGSKTAPEPAATSAAEPTLAPAAEPPAG